MRFLLKILYFLLSESRAGRRIVGFVLAATEENKVILDDSNEYKMCFINFYVLTFFFSLFMRNGRAIKPEG
ncbi:hypothetical protein S4054249_21230 [Pseudoalteromonas luteoviolacea]|uniref:Uncharacterized protein n=1 Tax=Pseudoalteromonas luteoviolacea S4054 TaxID=1129367 RepID=A0A0F6A7F2_9GAMM|nr:hypothetical protein S4054249_21230 [Pseudoalteromonas luteoviolacea]AOT15532.1 hypothetical protein S40542_22360 [Pseudoalteromonas luteoviolacea]AOT20217.1 hypothetical protein S4054_21145 [Pseudoalteromonas luteoviolacea]KKE82162.1 hypothetical protein N479_19355 [Pseudoalteromonas luteoviolacea S4054]KZN69684.1 hypothetical protein N481_21790 [Pseudoalteromonas luteoviolacea S4047-1]